MSKKQTVSPERIEARNVLATATRGAIDATLAVSNKIGALAEAIKGCVTLGITLDDVRAHSKRVTIAHVMGCTLAQADTYLPKGSARPEKLERALTAHRQSMSRAMALVTTGESSVRKAKKRKARAAGKTAAPVAPAAAPVPAELKSVVVPIASKPEQVVAFLLDSLALFERAEKSMAKVIDVNTRPVFAACITELRKVRK